MNNTPKEISYNEADVSRFWEKVSILGEDECWPWTQGTTQRGYGVFWVQGQNVRSNRFALLVSSGTPDDPSHLSLHECDNPICCNPKHLRWGTNLDNAKDRLERGLPKFGEHSASAVLTQSQVEKLYQLRLEGWTIREAAKTIGASYTAAENVLTGSSWKHLLGTGGNPTLQELRAKRPRKTKRRPHTQYMTDAVIDQIYAMRMGGMKVRDIAKELGFALGTVSPIFCGNTGTHRLGVDGNPTLERLKSVKGVSDSIKITEDDRAEILALLGEGYTGASIAKKFGVTPATISRIKNGH